MIYVFGRTPEGVFKSFVGTITETNIIKYYADQDHAFCYAMNDQGLILITPSIDLANTNLDALELLALNNPKYLDFMGKGFPYRGKGTHEIRTNGKWFNPLGSGGGNVQEDSEVVSSSLGDFTNLTSLLGYRVYDANSSPSSQVLNIWTHYNLEEAPNELRYFERNPDGTYKAGLELSDGDRFGQEIGSGSFAIMAVHQGGVYQQFDNGKYKSFRLQMAANAELWNAPKFDSNTCLKYGQGSQYYYLINGNNVHVVWSATDTVDTRYQFEIINPPDLIM